MTAQELNVEFEKRQQELRSAGMSAELDGPVAKKFEDEMMAMIQKDLESLSKK